MNTIRRANIRDSRDLFSWRNDPQTREASLNTSEISWEEHFKWYSIALHNPKIVFYICETLEKSASPIGMCRFNLSERIDSAEVSINLNPEYRGKGLSQGVLHDAILRFAQEFPGGTILTATIRASNQPSVKIFHSEGFVTTKEEDGVLFLELRLEKTKTNPS